MRRALWSAFLVALACEGMVLDIASVGSLSDEGSLSHKDRCLRSSGVTEFLQMLPEGMREPVVDLSIKHGQTLLDMFEKNVGMTPQHALQMIASATNTTIPEGLLPDPSTGAVALIELDATPGECIYLGVIATVCTLLSSSAVYNMFYVNNYIRKVDDNANELKFEDFGDYASSLYLDTNKLSTDAAKHKWTLPPSGFTDDEKKRYNDFLNGTPAPSELNERFAKRRDDEKKAYELFLRERMYVLNPKDKKFVLKVIVPAVAYFALHVASYMMAYQLGKVA